MYDDRLEITSHGGMLNGSRIQDLNLKGVPSMRRNEIIMEIIIMILVSKADIFHTESLRMRSKSIQGVFLLHLFRNDCKII